MSQQRHSRTAREAPAAPCVAVQIIVVTWTKRARGGLLATRRNGVPERLVLPTGVSQRHHADTVFSQTVSFDQSNDFAAPTAETVRVLGDLPVSLDGCLQLVRRDDTLAAKLLNYAPYVPTFPPGTFREHPSLKRPALPTPPLEPTIVTEYHGMGAPRRSVPLTPLVLRLGEWGQLRYLGRHQVTWGTQHVYRKYTFNIAWRRDVCPRIFVETEPHHRYDSMLDVW